MEQLDEIDIEILKQLQQDGRKSFNIIANELKVSPPTVKYRVDKLKNTGFIEKFSVILNPNKLKVGFFVLILIEAKFQEISSIVKGLEKFENIQEIYTSLDKNNIIAKIFVKDNEELNHFINQNLSQFEEINAFHAITILETIKKSETANLLRPGFGIRLFCDYCSKEIKEAPVKSIINNKEYKFCCNTCASVFKEKLDLQKTK